MKIEQFKTLEQIAYKRRVTNVISYFTINLVATLAIIFAIGVALDTALAAPVSTSAIIEQTDPITTSSYLPNVETHIENSHTNKGASPYANVILLLGVMAGSLICAGIGVSRQTANEKSR